MLILIYYKNNTREILFFPKVVGPGYCCYVPDESKSLFTDTFFCISLFFLRITVSINQHATLLEHIKSSHH